MNRYHLQYLAKSAHPLILIPRATASWVDRISNGNLFQVEEKGHETTEKKILTATWSGEKTIKFGVSNSSNVVTA